MLRGEYLGICSSGKFKHLDAHELIVSAYPYRLRQNVLSKLIANAVVGDGVLYSCRDIEAVLKQVINELPENYDTFPEIDGCVCVKLSW